MLVNSCREWRLLRTLKANLVGKVARYKPGVHIHPASCGQTELSFHNELAFIEAELLTVLQWQLSDPRLSQNIFQDLQIHFIKLCQLLDRFSRQHLAVDDLTRQKTGPYPNLQALLRYLGESDVEVNLFVGSDQPLFTISSSTEAAEALAVLGDVNEFMIRICTSPHSFMVSQDSEFAQDQDTVPPPSPKRAKSVLETFFRTFNCTSSHGILLQLTDATGLSGEFHETLEMLLSQCLDRNFWHEVQCVLYEPDFEISRVTDLCLYLQAHSEQEMLLTMLVQHQGIFTIKELPPDVCNPVESRPQPLSGLLDSGALTAINSGNFHELYCKDVLTARQKKAIALQLARCFMEFFDAEFASQTWDLQNIYVVSKLGGKVSEGRCYAAFNKSKQFSTPFEFTVIKPGPSLLSFAQTLLELELGKRLNFAAPDTGGTSDANYWPKLIVRAAEVEQTGGGLFSEAIKGCLYFHVYLALELESLTDETVDTKVVVRSVIYQRIVKPLEIALNPLKLVDQKRSRIGSYESDSEDSDRRRNSQRQKRSNPNYGKTITCNRKPLQPSNLPRATMKNGQIPSTARSMPKCSKLPWKILSRQVAVPSPSAHPLPRNPASGSSSQSVGIRRQQFGDNRTYHKGALGTSFSVSAQPSLSKKQNPVKGNTSTGISQKNKQRPQPQEDERPGGRKDFQIVIICALITEYDAVALLFDQFWDDDDEPYGRVPGDTNSYTTGRIGQHHVVLVLLPNMGKAAAAGSAANVRSSYPNLKLALIVGICGGVPRVGTDEALLGDVIISRSVVQYDLGRQYPGEFVTKDEAGDSLGRPNKDIRSLIASLETELGRERLQQKTAKHLKELQDAAMRKARKHSYQYPGASEDKLYAPTYSHRHQEHHACIICKEGTDRLCNAAHQLSCRQLGCKASQTVRRERLEVKQLLDSEEAQLPKIHFGRMASGDTVIKSGEHRDRIAKKTQVIAFEMEGAGAWEEIPCIVVKGICDYADSHKDKSWQSFAAATAASTMKALLGRYTLTDIVN